MCLVLHSDGHMTIKMLYEQIWPKLSNGRPEFVECYDIVFRWHSDTAFEKLYILSPHQEGAGNGVFTLVPDAALSHCDWVFVKKEPTPNKSDQLKLGFVGPIEQPLLEFDVTCLGPELRQSMWYDEPSIGTRAQAAFQGTGMTLSEVHFKSQTPVRKYDPRDPAGTTYYFRLAFQPVIQHLTEEAIPFSPGDREALFFVQPCAIMSPWWVLKKLGTDLDRLGAETRFGKAANRAKSGILDGIFARQRTSTRVEDHRISLVTSPNFLVLNSSVRGECTPLVIEPRELGKPAGLIRSCAAGANYHPHSDPLTLAREVYRYLRETAVNAADAKTKEAISSALACHSHYNVSHVVEALKALDLVKNASEKENYYMINSPALQDEKLFLQRVYGMDEVDLGTRDQEIRNRLYGEIDVPTRPREVSRFQYEGFSIFYDLAFCT